MLFISAAVTGVFLRLSGESPNQLINSGLYTFGRTTTYEIMHVYRMKMSGVFMISTCTLSLRKGIVPRWMAHIGLLLAVFLLLSLGFFYWAPLVFPLWVLLIRVHILRANLTGTRSEPEPENPAVT